MFYRSAERFPEKAALWVDDTTLTYQELKQSAERLAVALSAHSTAPTCALLAYRSLTAYTGVLASLAAGLTYVPLNPNFPLERNRQMLELSGAEQLVVDTGCAPVAAQLLAQLQRPLRVLLPEATELPQWARDLSRHQFVIAADLARPRPGHEAAPASSPYAYLLFTSGTTGSPKGVPIRHTNALTYVANITSQFDLSPEDRFTQLFDFTFDLSVHDMFVCWAVGACLYCVPQQNLMLPDDFVRQHQLTVWFSVPSAANFLKQFRRLKPNRLSSLRQSFFCGEALPVSAAQAWAEAAPLSRVHNIYGPTEATIAFTAYSFNGTHELQGLATVPIGTPLPGQSVLVVNERLEPVAAGESGELLLGGSQVADGYWQRPDLTAERFVMLPASGDASQRWYCTGDIVSQQPPHGLVYHGRLDRQIKIRGYRVEIAEIEATLREVAGTELVAVVPWPFDEAGKAQGVIAFGCGLAHPAESLMRACARVLPDYMVPHEFHDIDELPLNSNGKVDSNALIQRRRHADGPSA